MSRRAQSSHNHTTRATTTTTTSDAALLAADRVLSKQTEHTQGLKRIQVLSLMLAERIAHNNDVEVALLKDGDDNKSGDVAEFLNEERNRLKLIAATNARRMQDMDIFVGAVGSVRDEIYANRDGEEDESIPPPDYERILAEEIERRQSQVSSRPEDFYDHEFCRELRSRLGEKERKKKKKRSTGSGFDTDDDDDDDLEVMNTQATGSDHALKCPITGMLFVNPVKSTKCFHTYSRAGLAQMWKNKKRKCPVSGCPNACVEETQLEDDIEMEMKVKRYQKRVELMKRQQRMSGESVEDEVGEEVNENATTVID